MLGRLLSFFRSRFGVALLLVVLAEATAAWRLRFVQDDAFISYRYAENLAEGHGLVWNEGERTEGYTNFLWTVAIAALVRLGNDPVAASYALGMACFLGTLILTYKLAFRVLGTRPAALWSMALLGTNWTFLCFATGGMETQAQACLFTAIMYLHVRCIQERAWPMGALAAMSALMAAALLTRLDSAILVLPVVASMPFLWAGSRAPRQVWLWRAAALALPLGVLVGGWLLWKLAYYGCVLPNTYYVKVASAGALYRNGARYLQTFLLSYCLMPFPFLGAVGLFRRPSRSDLPLLCLVAVIGLWCLYLVKIGGDFIEFRFLVPVLPLVFILVAYTVFAVIGQRGVRIALLALVLYGSLNHAATFGRAMRMGAIANRAELQDALTAPSSNWMGIGQVLGRAFEGTAGPVIAVSPAGAIPYFSRLPCIDMLGLNDRWVARNGLPLEGMAGHTRLAPLSYLAERRVSLVIGQPIVKRASELAHVRYSLAWLRQEWWMMECWTRHEDVASLLEGASVIEIPLDAEWRVVVLYLARTAVVDEAAARRGWRIHPLLGAEIEHRAADR